MYSLTRLWFGLFIFAVAINLVPLIPGWEESQDSEARFVSQTHFAVCSSQAFTEKPVPGESSAIIVGEGSGTLASSVDTHGSSCELPPLFPFSILGLTPGSWPVGRQAVSVKEFSTAHPVRGPPRA